jgi:epoxyqueuosine reductase
MSCQEFHTAQFRVVVDSAPILERALAARTSKGFLGKNTCYIHPRFGSSLLLGELITDVQLEPDAGAQVSPLVRTPEGGCGTCRRCQVHCPTGALSLDYQIDAEKCLSYWTIENRGPIPVEYWRYLEKFWYGCDICQNVCPYNRPKTGTDFATLESRGLQNLDLAEVAKMNQDFYEKTFGGSPMTRAKSDGLRRNALIAMVVTNHARLAEVLCLLAETEPAGLMRETMNQIPSFLAMAKEDV